MISNALSFSFVNILLHAKSLYSDMLKRITVIQLTGNQIRYNVITSLTAPLVCLNEHVGKLSRMHSNVALQQLSFI